MAESDLQQGQRALREERWEDAAAALNAHTLAHGDDAQAWMWLGVAQAKLGSLLEAQTSLSQAAGLTPNDPAVHANLAHLFEKQGDLQSAADEYARAYVHTPESDAKSLEIAASLGRLAGEGFLPTPAAAAPHVQGGTLAQPDSQADAQPYEAPTPRDHRDLNAPAPAKPATPLDVDASPAPPTDFHSDDASGPDSRRWIVVCVVAVLLVAMVFAVHLATNRQRRAIAGLPDDRPPANATAPAAPQTTGAPTPTAPAPTSATPQSSGQSKAPAAPAAGGETYSAPALPQPQTQAAPTDNNAPKAPQTVDERIKFCVKNAQINWPARAVVDAAAEGDAKWTITVQLPGQPLLSDSTSLADSIYAAVAADQFFPRNVAGRIVIKNGAGMEAFARNCPPAG